MIGLETKRETGWRHGRIGRLRFGWKFTLCRFGYHSLGDGDGSLGLGFLIVRWIWGFKGEEK